MPEKTEELSWKDVFYGNKALWDTIDTAASAAWQAGYGYLAWNDQIYELIPKYETVFPAIVNRIQCYDTGKTIANVV